MTRTLIQREIALLVSINSCGNLKFGSADALLWGGAKKNGDETKTRIHELDGVMQQSSDRFTDWIFSLSDPLPWC